MGHLHRPRALLVGLVLTLGFGPAATEGGHDEEFIDTVPAERVKLLLDRGEKVLFIDLRPVSEFQKRRLPGARSIPSALAKSLSRVG